MTHVDSIDLIKLNNKKLFLLDMDGTIYLENKLIDGSLDFLDKIIKLGGKYIFITNNSSKSVVDYVDKVNRMGIKADSSCFYTSSQASAHFLKGKFKKIYVIGTVSLKNELKNEGLDITDEISDDVDCLLVGYDTELTYQKLIDACKLLLNDIAFFATNADVVCPVSFGYVPDCASICRMITDASGKKPYFIGKPEPLMILQAIAKSGFTKEQTIVIGDRMYTDIKSGLNADVTTALVLSGETKINDLKEYDFKPDYIFESVLNINNIIMQNKTHILGGEK